MTNNENTINENQEEQVTIESAINELEVLIPTQYARLDYLNNLYKTTRQEEKTAIKEQFWREGIAYRELMVFAFGLLRKHHHQDDEGLPEKYEELMGDSPFETLTEAKKYRDLVLSLLHNYQDKTESLDDEIEVSRMLLE